MASSVDEEGRPLGLASGQALPEIIPLTLMAGSRLSAARGATCVDSLGDRQVAQVLPLLKGHGHPAVASFRANVARLLAR